jgi:hypothetical protein
VRLSRTAVAAVLVLAACGGPTSPGTSPSANATATSSASPSSAASSTPTGSPGGAALVHCDTAVPAGDNLVIATIVETIASDPTIVVRDIQDPANAKTVCRFDAGASRPQFVSATRVAYEFPDNRIGVDNHILIADLASGIAKVIATYTAGFGSGQYAISPDGNSLTYLDGNAWHLITQSGNKLLTTLPAVGDRGVYDDEDDSFLSFSPDGLYVALVQTFHTGGTGQTAPDQVRKASDGSLVYSTSGMTMGVWASVPSRLFFRDSSGAVRRWDPSAGVTSMLPIRWIRPKSSPDQRWITYTFRASNGLGAIGFYSVQANSVSATTPAGRSDVRFLTNDLVFYREERVCPTCFGGLPLQTGVTYIYSIAGAVEVASRLMGVYDAWPHSTPPGP